MLFKFLIKTPKDIEGISSGVEGKRDDKARSGKDCRDGFNNVSDRDDDVRS